MNIKKTALRNGSVGFMSQVIASLFQFLTRYFFLQYLGIEVLGLNSMFASVFSAFALAELGFQSVVIYHLYKPIRDGDHAAINTLISIYRFVYRIIGIFFLVISVAFLPFLQYIIKGIAVDRSIYFYFMLQSASSAFTYFLSCKRALLIADQNEYIPKLIDTATNIVSELFQIYVIIRYQSYPLYLCIRILQVILSNIIVNGICQKKYPYLKPVPFDRKSFFTIWNDVKNLFSATIAGYIYGSTDNFVISILINTVTVGYYTNYQTVIIGIKRLTNGLLTPIAPAIGRLLIDTDSNQDKEQTFRLYYHIRFIIAFFLVIPCYTLINTCITIWVGSSYIMSPGVSMLLCFDLFIHLVHSGCSDYINGSGLFSQEKKIEIVGALINLILSVILCFKLGIIGILIGTVASQLWFWTGRSWVVYRYCFKMPFSHYWQYLKESGLYIIVSLFTAFISCLLFKMLKIHDPLQLFLAGGLLSLIICAISYFLFFGRSKYFIRLKKLKMRDLCTFKG